MKKNDEETKYSCDERDNKRVFKYEMRIVIHESYRKTIYVSVTVSSAG